MKNILLSAILLFTSYSASAQWQQTAGPTGGVVNCLTIMGSDIFAGTNGGVYVSSDNGVSWTAAKTGLPAMNITSLVQKGTDLFAGTNGGGVFKSSNHGASWSPVNTGLTSLSTLNVLALTVSGTNLFAGTGYPGGGGNAAGVYVSANSGASWTISNNGLPMVDTAAGLWASMLAANGTDLFAETGAIGTFGGFTGGLSLSTDNGANWHPVNSGLPSAYSYPVAALIGKDTLLFTGTGNGVYVSDNNGTTWTEADTGLTNRNIHAFAVSGSNLFAGTDNGVFLSTDNGATWNSANSGITNTPVNAIAINGSSLFAGTGFSSFTPGGIYMSSNNGSSWTVLNTEFPDMKVDAFVMSGSTIFAGTTNGGIFASSDNGATWAAKNNGLPVDRISALAVNGTILFAGTNSNGIYKSTDNGNTWMDVSSGFPYWPGDRYVGSLTVIGNNLYAGTTNDFLLSQDNGTSWTAIGSLNHITGLAVSGTNLIATSAGGILVFPNYSINCDTCTHFIGTSDETPETCVVVNGSYVFAGTYGKGILLSTDNGLNWNFVNSGLSSASDFTDPRLFVSALIADGTNVYAGTENGIFVSADNGASWTATTGINGLTTYAFAKSGTNLFAGTNVGVWKNSLTTGINEAENKNTFNVYPNPTSGIFSVVSEKPSDVKICVYDVFGNCLLNKNYQNETNPKIDLSNRSKGVYFLEIVSDDKRSVNKIVLQ